MPVILSRKSVRWAKVSCDTYERQFPLQLFTSWSFCSLVFVSLLVTCFSNMAYETESQEEEKALGGSYLSLRAEGNRCYLKGQYYDAIHFFTRVSRTQSRSGENV